MDWPSARQAEAIFRRGRDARQQLMDRVHLRLASDLISRNASQAQAREDDR
jgi:hypothetical protein